jgi:hypothetical protein
LIAEIALLLVETSQAIAAGLLLVIVIGTRTGHGGCSSREERAGSTRRSELNNCGKRAFSRHETPGENAMTYENDPDRLGTEPTRVGNNRYTRIRSEDSNTMRWGIPLVIAAVVLIGGLLFFNSSGDRATTASNEAPATRQTNPSAPAPSPAMPPAKTQ